MLLQTKNAVIYGAAGSLGGTIARAFAREGARVFLSGHKLEPVQQLAREITAAGGKAEAAKVDAMDEVEINKYVDAVVSKAGTIDISFNLINYHDVQDIPIVDMKLDDFARPIRIAMQTQFLTGAAAGRVMMKQGFGVILTLTATPGGIGYANAGGFGPACCAIESYSRGFAAELGPRGVRAVNIRSAGSPDSKVFKDAIDHGGERVAEFMEKITNDTMLKEMPMMEDIAQTAVFLASGMASKITGVTVDVTCGTTAALNYKVTPIAFVR
jgi:NAD(P)-dependent dehydrogenase (short-subunit alcohol dehydrogenase family)